MTVPICHLCREHQAIAGSHVTPALVYRAIKADSATGYLRRSADPNRRMQDGDKHPLLCEVCEQRFGDRENSFNNHIFKAFHESDIDSFDYGDWLHYFITSVTWRTLIMELADASTASRMPSKVRAEFSDAAEIMRRFLLGESKLASQIRNHVYLFSGEGSYSRELAMAGPHFLIRRSVGGYAIWTESYHSAVQHNLAGFWCVTLINDNPQDVWQNTKIDPSGGTFRPPQKAKSWIAQAFFEDIIESSKIHDKMSERQRAIANKPPKNPEAASLRFRQFDRRQRLDES
jgi:hypothetical protein